ncbi:Phosphatidylglycerol/phosphatidylinositol transfer protein [Debaryomyces fabryi]|uniref:Phosphatidylglycerol/phosphatidylinositol transfer protein n=1 Tax=Debaryomyces fabryi TaxID=58627 RepID=A0A0V1PXQ3_9ASCO|nr:Phosphatidylglycerol/phosphatidylinositol transfer protein [Debaryomyces fabryi]KSA00930.1 Phosphatidylglycerol/phosphatidylinositol transfer protein [Debaryomyces fabryi]CUM52408.1 unnamed protein product [Debaryomyces fabryi]
MVAYKSIALLALTFTIATVESLSIVGARSYIDKAMSVFDIKTPNSRIEQPELILTFAGPDDKPVPGDSPIVQCEASEPQLLNLQSVVIDPNPPLRGQNLTFVAKGVLSQDIEEGAYVEVDVRYGFIKLLHQTFDLCEEITKIDMECPISKGQQVIEKRVEIPAEVPPGKYIVNARAYTKDDIFITCLSAMVEFPPV